tara:strand:+ start:146 stop:340 length:195 start_codon:yes stop_codon:yes gene_type:complete
MNCLYCNSSLIVSQTTNLPVEAVILDDESFDLSEVKLEANEGYSELTLLDCSSCNSHFEAYKKR